MQDSNTPGENENIHAALELGYNVPVLTQYYDDWASSYDRDVHQAGYTGPERIVAILKTLIQSSPDSKRLLSELDVVDAGCGTGLVGMALEKGGFTTVDGFDLSETMVKKAKETGAYRVLRSGADMSSRLPYADNRYDITVCCGVFTPGHAPPHALNELVRITRSGGLVLVSTRRSYFEDTHFEKVCRELQETGRVSEINCAMNDTYLGEEDAHYWSFRVS